MVEYTNKDPYREFTEPFSIYVLDEKITWLPMGELMTDLGNEKARSIALSIEDWIHLAADYGEEIAVTPTGPFLLADLSDPYAVVWAVSTLYDEGEFRIEGEAPTMKEMGLVEPDTNGEDDTSTILY
jgi:hypothetical protein